MKTKSRVYPPAETIYAYAVATDTTELLALDRALSEGKSYCLKSGKAFTRRRSQATYQGEDRSTQAVHALLGESIGPAWEEWAGQKDFKVVIEFECSAP
jgi:hypothetical protein